MNTSTFNSSEWPAILSVSFPKDTLRVSLSDGRVVEVPLAWFPSLSRASKKELRDCKISVSGYGIHWPSLDEDLSVFGFLYAPANRVHKAA
ncbi:MAG: DUF2442 domain-containing protein [Elusimicrobia bacterium]|jgi:hypothetical protein|nr:DUF2442 domain-containing protein [Elusimicrobiota bacterium]